MPFIARILLRAVALLLLLVLGVSSGAAAQAVAPGQPFGPSPAASSPDLREVLAQTSSERDYLAQRLDLATGQRWLLIIYGLAMTVAAGWLGLVLLKRPAPMPAPQAASDGAAVEPQVGTAVTVRQRKNATITIRNGATQREEVVDNVQTRRFFPRPEARPRVDDTPTAQPALVFADDPAPELRPGTDRSTRASSSSVEPSTRKHITVRVEQQQSDRLPATDVALKPGTAAVTRRGFSLLEVMLSLAILATVLASVVGNMYTLHQARTLALEDSEARVLGGRLSELMMAESIWRLNDWVPTSSWHDAYADDPDTDDRPLDGPRLRAEFDNVPTPALSDLKVYLEYYRSSALEQAILTNVDVNAAGVFFIRANRQNGADRTMVMRIVITWQSTAMGTGSTPRRHTRLLVRSD